MTWLPWWKTFEQYYMFISHQNICFPLLQDVVALVDIIWTMLYFHYSLKCMFSCCRTWLPWWTTPGSISSPRWTRTDGRSPPMLWVTIIFFPFREKKLREKKVRNHDHNNLKHQYYLGSCNLIWASPLMFPRANFLDRFLRNRVDWQDSIIFIDNNFLLLFIDIIFTLCI